MAPRQKRALEEGDANRGPHKAGGTATSTNKRQKQKENQPPVERQRGASEAAASDVEWVHAEDDHDHEGPSMDELPPHEYILVDRPLYDFDVEAMWKQGSADEAEDMDDDETYDRARAAFEAARLGKEHGKPASSKPEHRWFMMRGTWCQFINTLLSAVYRDPDNFDMYAYNDFEGYGMHELVENILAKFEAEFSKKAADQSLEDMWSTISALVHWMNYDGAFMHFNDIDDCMRLVSCWDLIGTAVLAMLNVLDRAKQLGPDSKIKDLALVIALFLNLCDHWQDSEYECQLSVMRFVRDHTIELTDSGVSGVDMFISAQQAAVAEHEAPPKAAVDRWGFKKAFQAHARCHGNGVHYYDITRMSRAERRERSLHYEDPLAEFTDTQIKSGELMIV